jgi:hypothetical protein
MENLALYEVLELAKQELTGIERLFYNVLYHDDTLTQEQKREMLREKLTVLKGLTIEIENRIENEII